VTFKFKSSKRSNNGTDVASGQIPEILYRIPEVEKETGVPIQLLDKSFSSTVSAVCTCINSSTLNYLEYTKIYNEAVFSILLLPRLV
jgi:hypothetical protein